MSISHDTPNPSRRRWTPAAIRKATPFPKPEGVIEKLIAVQPTSYREEEVVSFICKLLDGADLLDVETVDIVGRRSHWLLVPVNYAELELLANFQAGAAELENGHDAEEGEDAEPDVDREPDLGACEQISQVRWGMPQERGHIVDAEREDELFEDGDDEPDHVERWEVPLYWDSIEAEEARHG